MDLSDGQWRDFRANLPLLLGLMVASSLLSRALCRPESVLDRAARRFFGPGVPSASLFHALLGVGVLAVQHGQQALAPLACILAAYLLALATSSNSSSSHTPSLRSRLRVPLSWFLAIAVLLVKESYRLRRLAPEIFYQVGI
jgi:hypothetical protein